jgi:hypothetical protein
MGKHNHLATFRNPSQTWDHRRGTATDLDLDKDRMVDNGINILVIMLHSHLLRDKDGRSSNSNGTPYLRMLFNITHIWVDRD